MFFDNASDSVTKWDGIIRVWFFIYATPFVIGFLVFVVRVRRFYEKEKPTRRGESL